MDVRELSPPRPTRTKGIETTLSEGEQLLARVIASLRQGVNRMKGVAISQMSPRDGFAIDLDGIGGELAYAKLMNLCPDLDVLPRKGSHDFTTIFNESVDVKTRNEDWHDLLVEKGKKKNPSDLYVQMIGKFPTYAYQGASSKDEVFLDSNLTDLGRGEGYLVPQARLKR